MLIRHMIPQPLKNSIRAVPSRARYWDGQLRPARYDLARIFNQWRYNPALRLEAEQSYNAYAGGDFLDIGAAAGFYAALLAPKARPGDRFVLCEPDSHALPRLFANISTIASQFPALLISVVTVPVGDGGKCAKTLPADGETGHYRFGESANSAGCEITTVTIDGLIESFGLTPAFVKIDVEGAEYNVLCGMDTTLNRTGPTIALEIHPQWLPSGITAQQVTNKLSKKHYTLHGQTALDGHSRQLWATAIKHPSTCDEKSI